MHRKFIRITLAALTAAAGAAAASDPALAAQPTGFPPVTTQAQPSGFLAGSLDPQPTGFDPAPIVKPGHLALTPETNIVKPGH